MKKLLSISLAIFVISQLLSANTPQFSATTFEQEKENNIDVFGFGFGFGLGFFYPGDVNQYLEDTYANMETINLNLYMNEMLALCFTIRPVKMFRINIDLEAGIGPKFVVEDNGDTEFYNLGRYSFGINPMLNVPMGSGKNSLLFGVGLMLHRMYFEDYKASTVGGRIIPFGLSFQFGNFQPQVVIGFDIAKATDRGMQTNPFTGSTTISNFDLNYTGGIVKVNLCF